MNLHPIAVADPPLRSSYGPHAPFALRTIVELVSDDGLIGFSETYGGEGPARTRHGASVITNPPSTSRTWVASAGASAAMIARAWPTV